MKDFVISGSVAMEPSVPEAGSGRSDLVQTIERARATSTKALAMHSTSAQFGK